MLTPLLLLYFINFFPVCNTLSIIFSVTISGIHILNSFTTISVIFHIVFDSLPMYVYRIFLLFLFNFPRITYFALILLYYHPSV